MNSKLFFILLLMVAGVAVFGVAAKPSSEQQVLATTQTEESYESSTLVTQSKTMGVVSVDVTPAFTELENGLVFDIAMNNHSVDLDYDFTQIVTLTDEKGNTYKPSEWTGNVGGHHVSGQLIFTAVSSEAKQLTLTLSSVDNETTDFSWEL